MSAKELESLDRNIERLQEQLAGVQDWQTVVEPGQRVRIKQQADMIRKEIRELEARKWELIAEMVGDLAIAEEAAEPILGEIVTEVAAARASDVSAEILALLEKIWAKLNEPGKPAAAKLKASISVIPPFLKVSYEKDLDVEKLLQRHLPTFSGWVGEVKERLKK